MKQINLLEILIKHIPTELYDPSLDKYYLSAMKEVCEATIDLCAENAIAKENPQDYGTGEIWVDEKSILKTKKQIV